MSLGENFQEFTFFSLSKQRVTLLQSFLQLEKKLVLSNSRSESSEGVELKVQAGADAQFPHSPAIGWNIFLLLFSSRSPSVMSRNKT